MNGTRNAREQTSGRDTYLIRVLMMISKPIGSDIQPGKERVEYERKDRDAYNFYKEELQKNGYISGDSKEWFAWFSECIKKEHPEVTCLNFTDAGMGQYIVMRKSIISKIERMVVQK